MSRLKTSWYSDRLEKEVTVVRWGEIGTPVLFFPTAYYIGHTGSVRLRVPMMPWLVLFAAVTVVWMLSRIRPATTTAVR